MASARIIIPCLDVDHGKVVKKVHFLNIRSAGNPVELTKKRGRVIVETSDGSCWFEVYTYGGRKATGLDAVQCAVQTVELGGGELVVTSRDIDGTEKEYDLELTRSISKRVGVPVIASGGAGKPEHSLEAFTIGKADAALATPVFHYDKYPIPFITRFLRERGVSIRL